MSFVRFCYIILIPLSLLSFYTFRIGEIQKHTVRSGWFTRLQYILDFLTKLFVGMYDRVRWNRRWTMRAHVMTRFWSWSRASTNWMIYIAIWSFWSAHRYFMSFMPPIRNTYAVDDLITDKPVEIWQKICRNICILQIIAFSSIPTYNWLLCCLVFDSTEVEGYFPSSISLNLNFTNFRVKKESKSVELYA